MRLWQKVKLNYLNRRLLCPPSLPLKLVRVSVSRPSLLEHHRAVTIRKTRSVGVEGVALALSNTHPGPGRTIPPVSCEICGVEIYRRPSVRKRSKHFFCCIEHRNLFFTKPDKVYSTWYRTLAFRNYPHECNRCGYDRIPEILVVHHLDHDRKNLQLENLEILCPTCHDEYHYETKTGKWRSKELVNA